jgi:hypothetical protein
MRKIYPVISVLFAMFLYDGALAGTWYVDGSVPQSGDGKTWETAFDTIQKGIDAAGDEDTVIVAQGTYTENIQFKGKNILLTGTNPFDLTVIGNTIIDGNQAGSVVAFSGTEGATCILRGFTIRNGKAQYWGGGICGVPWPWTNNTHATIRNNVVTGNSSDHGGGLSNCDGTIVNNLVLSNSATKSGGGIRNCNGDIGNNSIAGNTAGWSGGGLAWCNGSIRGNSIMSNSADSEGGGLYQCNGTVENNRIKRNSAWRGGGMYWCDATIRNNTITENSVAAGGGGLEACDGTIEGNIISGNTADSAAGLNGCNGIVQNNTITLNAAEWRGGGVGYCDGMVRNNTISGNSAEEGAGLYGCDATIVSNLVAGNSAAFWGGGVMWCGGAVLNNTIVGNSAGLSGGGLNNCAGTIANCIIWGNAAGDGPQLYNSSEPSYSCIQGWAGGGQENTDEDPRFVDADGPDNDPQTYEDNDYHLTSDSPCVDEGSNAALGPPGLDLDGNLRIARWKYPIVAIVDMGAYEYNSRPFAISQFGFTNWPPPGGRYLVWNSQPNDTYTVWSSYSLAGEWHELGSVASQGETTSYTVTGLLPWNWHALFYRVEME